MCLLGRTHAKTPARRLPALSLHKSGSQKTALPIRDASNRMSLSQFLRRVKEDSARTRRKGLASGHSEL